MFISAGLHTKGFAAQENYASPMAVDVTKPRLSGLIEAVERYFGLMYDCDTSKLEEVFLPTAVLHGYRDGELIAWPLEAYRIVLAKRQSPKSLGAIRADDILLIDFASDEMAFVKVRLRINSMVFVDDLTWHRFQGNWLISSKGFHLEADDDAHT